MDTSNPSGRYSREWVDALADAAVDPAAVPFVRYDSATVAVRVSFWDRRCFPGNNHATAVPPGDSAGEGFTVEDEGINETFRVMICVEGRSEVLVASLLRHELEHVRQIARCRPLATLHYEATCLLSRAGLTGTEYNELPMEREANRAARDFIRLRSGDEALRTLASLPEWPKLTPAGAALDPEQTAHEMLAFCDRLAAKHATFVTPDYREALECVRRELAETPESS